MQPNNGGTVYSLGLPATALVVPGLLSAAECEGLVARAEAAGFEAAAPHYPPGYRDNDRLVLDDAELAAALWPRVAPFVPEPAGHPGDRLVAGRPGDRPASVMAGYPSYPSRSGAGRPVALNPRFRLCRYRGGQSFCIHRDGPYIPSATRRSLLTCQIYLNDGAAMTGGQTRFYGDPRDREPLAAVSPSRGAAILFDHGLWHDGEPVTAGTKWVLRTDVLFEIAPQEAAGGHLGYVWAVCALPDGGLATAGRDGTVRGHDLEGTTLRHRWTREAHAGSVLALAGDRSGRLWSAGRDHTLRVAASPGAPFELAHEGGAAVLSLIPHKEGVAASLADGTIVLAGRESTRVFRPSASWAWSIASLPDGRLATVNENGQILLLDPYTGATQTIELGVALRSVLALGDQLLVGDASGTLHGLAASSQGFVESRRVHLHEGAITTIAATDEFLVTGSEDQKVRLLDRRGWEPRGESLHRDFVRSVVALPGGRVASGSYDGEVRVARIADLCGLGWAGGNGSRPARKGEAPNPLLAQAAFAASINQSVRNRLTPLSAIAGVSPRPRRRPALLGASPFRAGRPRHHRALPGGATPRPLAAADPSSGLAAPRGVGSPGAEDDAENG